MKRRLIPVLICLIPLLCAYAWAAQPDTSDTGTEVDEKVWEAQKEVLDTDQIELESGAYTGGMTVENADFNQGLQSLLETGGNELLGVFQKALRSGIVLLVLVLLCQVTAGFFEDGTPDVVYLGGALAVTATAAVDMSSLVGLGRGAIDSMETFSKALLPTLAASTSVAGAPASSAARQMATMLFSDIMLTVINRFLLPMVYAYIALCAAKAALGNDGLGRMAGLIKWGSTSALSILLLVFTGYLTISGAIAGSTDATTLKAAKFAVSTAVPVVGGILSDATESILAGASLMKNAIGIIGMLTVLGICLIPFLQLAVHYLVYKVTAALAATVADSRLAGLIDGIGGAFGLIMGMTGACAVLLLISIVSAITAIKGG